MASYSYACENYELLSNQKGFLSFKYQYNQLGNYSSYEKYFLISSQDGEGHEQALVFLGNNRVTGVKLSPKKEIPHEIMHCLGLPHVFLENGDPSYFQYHYFTKSSTDNYMDYENTAEHSFCWQWKSIKNSRFIYK